MSFEQKYATIVCGFSAGLPSPTSFFTLPLSLFAVATQNPCHCGLRHATCLQLPYLPTPPYPLPLSDRWTAAPCALPSCTTSPLAVATTPTAVSLFKPYPHPPRLLPPPRPLNAHFASVVAKRGPSLVLLLTPTGLFPRGFEVKPLKSDCSSSSLPPSLSHLPFLPLRETLPSTKPHPPAPIFSLPPSPPPPTKPLQPNTVLKPLFLAPIPNNPLPHRTAEYCLPQFFSASPPPLTDSSPINRTLAPFNHMPRLDLTTHIHTHTYTHYPLPTLPAVPHRSRCQNTSAPLSHSTSPHLGLGKRTILWLLVLSMQRDGPRRIWACPGKKYSMPLSYPCHSLPISPWPSFPSPPQQTDYPSFIMFLHPHPLTSLFPPSTPISRIFHPPPPPRKPQQKALTSYTAIVYAKTLLAQMLNLQSIFHPTSHTSAPVPETLPTFCDRIPKEHSSSHSTPPPLSFLIYLFCFLASLCVAGVCRRVLFSSHDPLPLLPCFPCFSLLFTGRQAGWRCRRLRTCL